MSGHTPWSKIRRGHADDMARAEALMAENPALRDTPIIRPLLAENQRLEAAKANAETALMQQVEMNTRTTAELLESVAENQRYEKALERIARMKAQVSTEAPAARENVAAYALEPARRIAREALAGEDG